MSMAGKVLSFIPGSVPWPDEFGLLEPRDRLARVARLIRDFHDAVTGFVPPPDAHWQVLIPAEGDCDIIAHHDLAPWNLVIGSRWAFIDWELAAPGNRLWDVAYAVHGFAPLSANPRWQRPDAAFRVRAFADAYGLDEAQRRELVPLLTRRTRAMHDSWPARPAQAFSPGPACGKPVTATPGRLMPTTPKPVRPSWPPRWSVDTPQPSDLLVRRVDGASPLAAGANRRFTVKAGLDIQAASWGGL